MDGRVHGADVHIHEPTPGPNTGDVVCRTCGAPLSRLDLNLKRGYGGVAASVDGVVVLENSGMAVPDIEPFKNRKARRAEKAKARHGSR